METKQSIISFFKVDYWCGNEPSVVELADFYDKVMFSVPILSLLLEFQVFLDVCLRRHPVIS